MKRQAHDDLDQLMEFEKDQVAIPKAFLDDPNQEQDDRPIMKRQRTEQAEFITTEMTDAVRKSINAAQHLPIAKKKNEILDKLKKNRVLIISGDTGCGKTTQVPKYIIQQAQSSMEDVYIICT